MEFADFSSVSPTTIYIDTDESSDSESHSAGDSIPRVRLPVPTSRTDPNKARDESGRESSASEVYHEGMHDSDEADAATLNSVSDVSDDLHVNCEGANGLPPCSTCQIFKKCEDLYIRQPVELDAISEYDSDEFDDEDVSDADGSHIDGYAAPYAGRSSSAPPELSARDPRFEFAVLFPSLASRSLGSSASSPGNLSGFDDYEINDHESYFEEESVPSPLEEPGPHDQPHGLAELSLHQNVPLELFLPAEGTNDTALDNGAAESASPTVGTCAQLPFPRSPNSSPRKRILSRALTDIARILRGQSPQPAVFDSAKPEDSTKGAAVSGLEIARTPSITTLDDAASGPSLGEDSPDSIESIDPAWFPRPLAVRNRSSQDSIISPASMCRSFTGHSHPASDESVTPRSLVKHWPALQDGDGNEDPHSTIDHPAVYRGSWPSLQITEAAANRLQWRQESLRIRPVQDGLLPSQNMYQATPFSRSEDRASWPQMDNFLRLRLSGASSTDDPFYDALAYQADGRDAFDEPSIGAHGERLDAGASHGLHKVANLSLWPRPLGVSGSVGQGRSRPQAQAMQHIAPFSTTFSKSIAKDPTELSHRRFTHESDNLQRASPTVLVAHKSLRGRMKKVLSRTGNALKRGLSCATKGRIPEHRDEVISEHPPVDVLGATEPHDMPNPSLRRRSAIAGTQGSPPIREWITIPSEPNSPRRSAVNLGDGRALVYVPRHTGDTPPQTLKICPHGSWNRCLRCSTSRYRRRAMMWMLVNCCCQEIPAAELEEEALPLARALRPAKQRSDID